LKLEGTLALFPLSELIAMVAYSSVTGALSIRGSGDIGTLYFRDGLLYHARWGSLEGAPALAALLELRQAHFSFVSNITTEAETLQRSSIQPPEWTALQRSWASTTQRDRSAA
jgi:hypothetical protein